MTYKRKRDNTSKKDNFIGCIWLLFIILGTVSLVFFFTKSYVYVTVLALIIAPIVVSVYITETNNMDKRSIENYKKLNEKHEKK